MAASSFLRLLLVSHLLSFLPGSEGISYTVGDSLGWTIPSESNLTYEHWAASHSFHVGDSLVFKYASELHSVLQVTRSSYKQCNVTSSLSMNSEGKTVIILAHPGSYYFICGIPGHCQAGQRFQLKAVHTPRQMETLQGEARDNAAMTAPTPAPVNGAEPPATSFTPSLPYGVISLKVLMTLVMYAFFFYPCVHAISCSQQSLQANLQA